jgi:PAS domain S-box-containing protein
MAALVLEFGSAAFMVDGEAALRLRDRTGRWRRFRVWRVDAAWLVQEWAARGAAGGFAPLPAARFYPMLRLNAQGRVVEANAAAGELLAYFFPGGDERISEVLASAYGSGERSVDLDLGGRVFSFAVNPMPDGFLLFGREITERRHAEATLRQNEARLRSLLEAAPDAIVTVAPDGRIDFVNPQGAQMFGYRNGALQGGAIEQLIPDWFRLPTVLAVLNEHEARDRGWDPTNPVAGVRADGSRFPVELSASALDREGRIYVTAIVRDVTEREAAAREIRELNEHLQRHVAQLTSLNAELEAFSYSVSHDLRGPLRSIDGFSGLLLEEYGPQLDDVARQFLARVRAATARMADLIDVLLRLSRITRADLTREAVDLSVIARFVAEGLQRDQPERQVEFRIEEGVWADGDRALLTVVLENLLNNAWKFTAQRAPGQIAFGVTDEEGRRVYYVRDNGAGFDMAYAGKLFVPFERLHEPNEYPGSGIGLATVHRVVRRHGGAIWAEGEVDRGATFCFTLG